MGGLIDSYLNSVVTITPKGTLGGDGKYNFDGVDVVTKAWVSDHKKLLRGMSNSEIVADRMFWFSPDDTVTIGDRITWGTVTHEVVEIYRAHDIAGVSEHTKAWVKIL